MWKIKYLKVLNHCFWCMMYHVFTWTRILSNVSCIYLDLDSEQCIMYLPGPGFWAMYHVGFPAKTKNCCLANIFIFFREISLQSVSRKNAKFSRNWKCENFAKKWGKIKWKFREKKAKISQKMMRKFRKILKQKSSREKIEIT